MKIFLIFIGFLQVTFLCADDLKIGGTVYKNASITEVSGAYATVIHDSGIARVMLADLPEDLRRKYGYDPQKAADEIAREHAQQEAAKRQELGNAAADFDRRAVFVSGSVSQVSDEGIMFRGEMYRFNDYSVQTWDGHTITRRSEGEALGSTGLIFIAGAFAGTVDGDKWSGRIWPAGTYRYESVGEGTKTIARWATTREQALHQLGK